MLTSIRGKSKSWIVKVLFAFLIVAFGAWGIGDIFANRGLGKPVLQVGEMTYSQEEFSGDIERQVQQFRQQGLNVNAQQLAAFGAVDQILRQATSRMLLEQYANSLKLTVPQSVVVADIQNNPAFYNAAGQFDRDVFLGRLQEARLTEPRYVGMLTEERRQQQLMTPIFASVTAPSVLTDQVFGYTAEKRTADVLIIPDESVTVAEPDQAAIEKFYNDNIANYQRPEYRQLVVLHLTPEQFVGGVTVDEQQIKEQYEQRKAEFGTPEVRAVEQVVVQDQAKADAVAAAVKGGKSFADAVTEITGGAPIDLGEVTKEKLPADIREQSFALAADAVSEPLKSAFGIHVVHVKSITPGAQKTYDEVKDQLKNEIALGLAGDAMVSILNQLDDALASGAPLEEVASKLSLKAEKIEAVDANGKDRNDADVAINPEILQLAQQTEADSTSLITTLSDGTYAVVQVVKATPAEPRPLAEISDKVKEDWLSKARRDAADAKAKELADKLKAGADFDALAKELSLTTQVTTAFTRDQGDPANGVASELAQGLFAVKQGEAATGRTEQGAVVARVASIEPAKAEDDKELVEKVSQQVAQSLRSDLRAAFLVAIGQEIRIERNNDVIEQMLAAEQ